ncbi:MAG: glycoside hydrolase family 3 C-terminal domain-containing protein [Clostridia bacterium]|nr:glycoside hydrolase family 3 C-terminal domain-containing protein [Clostridia bacterium]
MKRVLKKIISFTIALGMAASAIPAFAYNATPSDLTGNMDGLQMAKTVAEEGMVLLENNGALPLTKGEKIAVFGINQIDFIYGGGGSGNFNSKNERVDYISLYDALKQKEEEGEIELYEELLNSYETYFNNYWSQDGRTYGYGTKQGAVLMYWGEMEIDQAQVNAAAEAAGTAIITIGRPAGEDKDRANSEGDFKLSEKERNMINYVKAAGFDKVIVILNVTGVIESDWLKDEAIDAVLYVSLPGMVGGSAMADVLMGDSYPSGKLVDTWAANYTDYPSSANFGNSSYTNYTEDIFVGYRYFETIPGAQDKVNYPFGFGLTYADFEITDESVTVTGTGRDRQITVTATVTNNGEYMGKEVLQVYVKKPETTLTQPNRVLCGFYKTKELKGGESESVTITVPFDSLASYDDMGTSGFEAAYVLEEGNYEFYVGNSVRAPYTDTFTLDEMELTEQLEHHIVPNTSNFNSRLTSDGTYETITQKQNAAVSENPEEDVDARYKAVYTNENVTKHEDEFITFNELAKAFCDGEESIEDTKMLEAFVARLTDEEAVKLTGCTNPESGRGHRTGIAGIDAYGVPIIGTSNGPAGIQYNGSQSTWETTSTFYPCATMQACTWNEDLIEKLGAAMGDEARYFGMSLWQAPGMNIHRDPLCGRNFEYFAEDPFVTGKIGAAVTRGVQSRKFASQLKHFAFNNQEKGRWGNDSRMSERAAREIYLKGYEIAIKEGNPWSIMSSYNRINGTQTSGSYQLLTEILRNEWGYEGFVMTDFRTQNVSHAQEIYAGNDLKAPADSPRPENVYSALKDGSLSRWQVNRSAERVLRFVLKTEDALLLADEEFDYNVTISVDSDKITVSDGKVKMTDTITWGEFLGSITATYGQTFVLSDKDGNMVTDEATPLEIGMKIIVTAEDGVTEKTFEITGESLALKKNVKASKTESGYPATNAVDGDYTTRWSGFSQNYVWNDWIEVDLGDDYHVTAVDVSYYKGNERSYSYEILTAPSTSIAYWSDTNKNRDFTAQGYTLAASGDSDYKTVKSESLNEYARFVNLKTTGSVGAFGPTLWEIEVYGWKLYSDEYIIDEENKTIGLWAGETTGDALAKLKLKGQATMEFVGENDTWVNTGEKFVVTDQNGVETEYTINEVYRNNTDLVAVENTIVDINDKVIYMTGNVKADAVTAAVRNLYNGTIKLTDVDNDGFMSHGDTVTVTAEDNATEAVYTVIEGEVSDAIDASATYTESNSYVAKNVIDNSLSTRWSAYNRGVPQAICIDLGEEKTITALGAYFFGDGRESTYNVYVTNEPTVVNGTFTVPEGYKKENLTSVGSGANGGEGSSETFDVIYATGRYVTIYTTANSNNVVSLWEADIYTAPENNDIVIEVDSSCIIGLYEADGTFIEAIETDKTITIPYNEKIGYAKIFKWESVGSMSPEGEVEIINIK